MSRLSYSRKVSSVSMFSNQIGMLISRYIAVAAVRCSCASWRLVALR